MDMDGAGRLAALVVGLLALGILMTIGLTGAFQREDEEADEAVEAIAVSLVRPDARAALPEFTATTTAGEEFASSDLELPAVLKVFASWCGSCEAEASDVADMLAERPDANVYFIAVEDRADLADAFVVEHGWDAAGEPVVIDDADRTLVSDTLGVGLGQPHTVMVNAAGEIAWVRRGPAQLPELLGAIDAVSADGA